MALRILMMILASFCLAVAGQENERKNIKMLFVPADVMKALRKNLTAKDLPPGLPGQGTQRWTPVRLPGDKTHTFEIRINPRTAHKLNMNFQHFRVGRGHGLLLELKNVSLSTKGRTVLDRLVEFYKNCGSGRGRRIGMRPGIHMLHRLGHLHSPMHHSLLLPGDVPLLKRIQTALERFFPRRHDGSVDVFQHKDSSGAVHFLPFEEVRREVNNLIKRTIVKRDCVKISTNALTRALDAFRRRQLNNSTGTSSTQNESSNVSDESESENNDNNGEGGNSEGEEKDQVLSFSRNLDSFNPHPVNKANLTSSSAMNVPSDAAATKIVSALADLRKEISDLSSGFRQIPKDSDSESISVGTDDYAAASTANIVKISSDNNEAKDGKKANPAGFDISVVKNRRKKMSNDDNDEVGKKNSSNENNNDNNNNNKNNNDNNDNNKSNNDNNNNINNNYNNNNNKNNNDNNDNNKSNNDNNNNNINNNYNNNNNKNNNDNNDNNKSNNDNNNNNINNNDNNNNNRNNNDNNNNNINKNNSSNSDISNNKGIILALKLKNIEEDLKNQLVNDFLEQTRNFSKITSDSASANIADEKLENNGNVKITNVKPVHPVFNQVVNHVQRVKATKEVKVDKNLVEQMNHSGGTKKVKKEVRFKGRARNKNKHAPRLKDKKNKKRPTAVFHYKPRSIRLKLKYKGERYAKADDEDEEEDYPKHRGKGRLIQFIHMRRRHPKIKEVLLPDEEEDSDGYRDRKFDDSPVEASEDDDRMKVRLLRKLRWLRIHGHGAKIRRRKSPKLRVVVYDDEEEDKQPHRENWHNNESDELTEKVEKIHEDDSEADSESEAESDSEPESVPEPSPHRSNSVFMDDENTQQFNQGGTSNSSSDSDSDSDMQYLSDSIGDDSSHLGRSDSGADVPDLEPYLKKNYENEEDEENEEIKMYNEQDGIDARKLGDSMEKRKTSKEDDTMLSEKTNKLDDSDGEEPGKIHIHKIPFKIQEDSEGVDTSLLKEPPHESLGLQQVLSHESDMSSMASPEISSMPSTEMSSMASSQMTSMASQPIPMTSNPPPPNQNAMDMSPNMVMPPDQATMIPATAELPQVNGGAQAARPNVAAFNYQPSVTTQVNSMMPQTPFPQVSSMMPMQMSPMTPVMQPGQMRAVISRGEKKAPKKSRSRKRAHHVSLSGVGHKRVKLSRKKSSQSSRLSTV